MCLLDSKEAGVESWLAGWGVEGVGVGWEGWKCGFADEVREGGGA